MPKSTDRMSNSVDPDQTAPTDLGLHCLLRPTCTNISQKYFYFIKTWKKKNARFHQEN